MFVRIANIVLALGLVALLGLGYWLFWRPLPKTDGSIRVGVTAPVESVRDALGVPHLRAANEEDLYFAQGYVTAQERLWQMDGLRRFAAGDLAEIVGRAALASDMEARRLRIRHIAEEAYLTLPATDRAQAAAYARGVNAYIDTHRKALSFEFEALRYSPRPWSVVDSLIVGLYMYRTLTTSWTDEITKATMLIGGDAAKVNRLFPLRSGLEFQPGSNAWAVSGAHTASGRPLLANDMHLEASLPGIWFMVSLEAPGMHVEGVALPGMPGVIVGHNDRIAWGVTNLGFDVQDLYVEQLDEGSGVYQYDGHAERARLEREIIAVKGEPAVELKQWITRHGPVRRELGRAVALRWTAAEPGTFQLPFVEINHAHNWTEFLHGVARLPGPGQNFVYADVDGNIGYHASGRLPIRHGYAGDVPVDGTAPANEWAGYIPFEALPSAFNPPGGYIVTANQNPFPVDYGYPVNGGFATHYRSNQIRNLLRATPKLTPADSLRIQKDVYGGFADFFARQVVRAADRKHPGDAELRDAVALLRNFNGQMDKDAAAPLVVDLAYRRFRVAVAQVASPGKGAIYQNSLSLAVLQNLLTERPAGWFADYDDALLQAVRDGLKDVRTQQGRAPKKWRYGQYLSWTIPHPVGHSLPGVATYFDVGPVDMSGSGDSVKQTGARLGPSERINEDVGAWDNSLWNIVIGESGHLLSRHYKDQWSAYYNGTSFPMQFGRVEQKSRLLLEPR